MSYAADNLIIFAVKYLTIETRLYIEPLNSYFKNKILFTTQDLEKFFKEMEGDINRNTLNWRVFQLVGKGVISRIGKGQFRIGKGNAFDPEPSPLVLKLNNHLKKNFPFLKYCLWDSETIRTLSLHLPSLKLTIVDVERDGMESVFYSLQEKFKNVFLSPDHEIMDKYVINATKPIIVKALITEAPTNEINGIITGSIEKILVDVFFEEEFKSLRGSEMVHIFNNAFEMYPINTSKLLRYSARKRKKKEMMKFLTTNNLAAI